MSKLKTKYNFLIFIFLILTLVFCIDGVKAYTIYENDEIKIDEEFIIDKFNQIDGYNYEEYNYIICNLQNKLLSCSAYSEDFSINSPQIDKTSREYYVYLPVGTKFFHFQTTNISTEIPEWTYSYLISAENAYPNNQSVDLNNSYTNFDLGHLEFKDYNSSFNVLDFEGTNLQFNENLFKDNPDFKQVCVDSNKKFAITATSLDSPDENKENYDVDYMWFPYQLIGLNSAFYDSSIQSMSYYYDNLEDSQFHYYFNSIERINDVYNNDIYFSKKGYTNSNSYYLWSIYSFEITDKEDSTIFKFFWFENPITITQGSSGTLHGGAGSRLESDKEIELNKQYCFYIKNQYNVEYLNVNEYGDVYGSVTLPSGSKNIVTTYWQDYHPTDGLLSQVIVFIHEISDTIRFINHYVYEFYLSMPLLLRMFLTSLFTILIVKFIIGMVVK